MDTSPGPYDPPFSSYVLISCKNGAQTHQKWNLDPQKMVPPKFWGQIRIQRPRKPP